MPYLIFQLFFVVDIHGELAEAKYAYWSSFAPCPLELVLDVGQRAKQDGSFGNFIVD